MADNQYNKKNKATQAAPKRLFYLDVIRVASAILIVVYHFSYSVYLPPPFQAVDILHGTINGSWGMTPVYCFFMVSGAALMSRYGKEEKLDIRKYCKKRLGGDSTVVHICIAQHSKVYHLIFLTLWESYRSPRGGENGVSSVTYVGS